MGNSYDGRQESPYRLKNRRDKQWVDQIIGGVPEGVRHSSAVQLVGRWYGLGLSAKEVLIALFSWNKLNSPPLDSGELESIIRSTMKWERPF